MNTIRQLTADDIDALVLAEQACFTHAWTRQMFCDGMQNPNFFLFGSFCGAAFAGFIGFWEVLDELHIANVAVLPEFRRQGAAAGLIDFLLSRAREKHSRVTLEVRRSNQAAINLYVKKGFRIEGVRPRYYENTEDALIMWVTS